MDNNDTFGENTAKSLFGKKILGLLLHFLSTVVLWAVALLPIVVVGIFRLFDQLSGYDFKFWELSEFKSIGIWTLLIIILLTKPILDSMLISLFASVGIPGSTEKHMFQNGFKKYPNVLGSQLIIALLTLALVVVGAIGYVIVSFVLSFLGIIGVIIANIIGFGAGLWMLMYFSSMEFAVYDAVVTDKPVVTALMETVRCETEYKTPIFSINMLFIIINSTFGWILTLISAIFIHSPMIMFGIIIIYSYLSSVLRSAFVFDQYKKYAMMHFAPIIDTSEQNESLEEESATP